MPRPSSPHPILVAALTLFLCMGCRGSKAIFTGGDGLTGGEFFLCPFYHFSPGAKPSDTLRAVYGNPISRAPHGYENALAAASLEIRKRAGDCFFSMVRFEGIDIVIPDSLKSLRSHQRLLDPAICRNNAYLVHYRFQQDRLTRYLFVVQLSADLQVLAPVRIPNRPVCRLISPFLAFRKASRRYDRIIQPLLHIELAYNDSVDNFVWRFVSKSQAAPLAFDARTGRVEVDAMNGNVVHHGTDTSMIFWTLKF